MPPNVRRRPSRRCRTSSLPGNRKILLTHQRPPGRVKGRAAFFPPLKGTCERSRIHQRRSRRGAQRQMKFPRLQTDVIKRNPLCARNHPPLRRPPKNAPGLHKCQAPIRLFNCKRPNFYNKSAIPKKPVAGNSRRVWAATLPSGPASFRPAMRPY